MAASTGVASAARVTQAEALPAKAPLALRSPVEDKNFFVLAALQEDSQVRTVLLRDQKLNRIASERANAAKAALQTCKGDAPCTVRSLLWTDEEIWAVSLALGDLYRSQPPLRTLVEKKLRASGTYMLFEQESGGDLLNNAWDSAARGINDVLLVYGEGAPPRYPRIDSLSFDVQSDDFKQRITALAAESVADAPTDGPESLFFEPSLKAALALLAMNHRDEAGRHEPMESGVNKAAFQALPSIHWSKYLYSVIVVPGAGPQDLNTPLSAAGRDRTALAAERYHAGQAPLILVSGGYVHPSQTRFSEALEMKRALLEDYHVPESAILVDPHARHTTTNMRNAVREIYRYGIPMNKPALVVSDAAQIAYIAGTPFADRCMRELGYMPYRIVRQVSPTDLVFLPQIDSLEIDPMDPLDP